MTNSNTTQIANTSDLNTQYDTCTLPKLPCHGFSRVKQLLPFLPIGESTLWKWVKEGKFVQPVKLSPTVTAFENAKVHAWFKQKASNDENYNNDGVA